MRPDLNASRRNAEPLPYPRSRFDPRGEGEMLATLLLLPGAFGRLLQGLGLCVSGTLGGVRFGLADFFGGFRLVFEAVGAAFEGRFPSLFLLRIATADQSGNGKGHQYWSFHGIH